MDLRKVRQVDAARYLETTKKVFNKGTSVGAD